MKGLNLAEMKKVSEDKDSATFKHKDGHTIKVATKALSPAMKKELAKLPVHAAEGDDVQSQEPHALPGPTDPTVGIPEDAANVALQSAGIAPQEQASLADVPQSDPQEAQQQQPAREPAAAKKMPDVTPPQAPDSAVSPGQENLFKTADQHKQELSKEQVAWQNDLNNGHIEPKTYQSLYGKSDTLGKIGTIFGLLIGGAGAGLSHQPNALLGMMEKELERDYNAQVKSKDNAQNFLRIQQQQQMNDANIELMKKQGVLTEAQAEGMKVQTKANDFALTQARMLQTTFHDLSQMTKRLPEGQEKQKAMNLLGTMSLMVGQKINNLNDLAVGMGAAGKMLTGSGGSESSADNMMLRAAGLGSLAEAKESHTIPGFGQTEIAPTKGDRDQVKSMQEFDKQVKVVRDWAKKHSGVFNQLDVSARNYGTTQLMNLQKLYRELQGMGQLKGYDIPLLDKEIGTNPMSVFNSITNDKKLAAASDVNQSAMQAMMNSLGAKNKGDSKSPAISAPKEKIAYGKNGEKVVLRGGKWVPFK